MAFLTGRMMMWVIASAAAMGVVAALYFGAINRGKRIAIDGVNKQISERREAVRSTNHRINMDTLEREAELAEQKSRIIDKWSKPSSQ